MVQRERKNNNNKKGFVIMIIKVEYTGAILSNTYIHSHTVSFLNSSVPLCF